MTDQILTQSAIEKSFDNLTIVIISFKNLENFFLQKEKRESTPQETPKTPTIQSNDDIDAVI